MVTGARTVEPSRIRSSRSRRVLPAEVRVDDLMSAASALFIAKGIEATTVNDIVERAGVAKGTFYHYFETKEDVIVALRERFSRDFTAEVAQAIASCPTDDHRARFAAWLRGTVEAYIANYKLHDVVFHEFRPGNRNVKDKEIVLGQLGELLADGMKAGAWKLPDVRAAAIVFFDGMHGVVDDAIAAGQRDAELICSRLLEVFSRILQI